MKLTKRIKDVCRSGASNTQNYPALSSELSDWIETLKGEKNNFGSYQELGRIHIDDSLDTMIDAYVTNCYCTNITALLDGVKSGLNKWFSPDSADYFIQCPKCRKIIGLIIKTVHPSESLVVHA